MIVTLNLTMKIAFLWFAHATVAKEYQIELTLKSVVLYQSSLISWKNKNVELNFFSFNYYSVSDWHPSNVYKITLLLSDVDEPAINEFSEFPSWNISMTHWHTFEIVNAHIADKICLDFSIHMVFIYKIDLIVLTDCKSCRPTINVYSTPERNSYLAYFILSESIQGARCVNFRSILLLILRLLLAADTLLFKANFCLFVLWKRGEKPFPLLFCSVITRLLYIYYHHWILFMLSY